MGNSITCACNGGQFQHGEPWEDPVGLDACSANSKALREAPVPISAAVPESLLRAGSMDSPAASSTDMAARKAAYLERKKSRKESRARSQTSLIGQEGFLSNVPEVEADIDYRFTFSVVGAPALEIIKATCSSEAAHGVVPHADQLAQMTTSPGGFGLYQSEASRDSGAARSSGGIDGPALTAAVSLRSSRRVLTEDQAGGRCLSAVDFSALHQTHQGNGTSKERLKLAKLIFHSVNWVQGVPPCTNRADALSNSVVFVLVVDPQKGEPTFEEQLLQYERAVYELRARRRILRPARAILLHCRDKDSPQANPSSKDGWAKRLDEWEQGDGPVCKFGPLDLRDPDAYHAVFARIASDRIVRSSRSDGGESDGSQESDAPPAWEAESDLIDARDSERGEGSSQDPSTPKQFRHSWLSNAQKGAA